MTGLFLRCGECKRNVDILDHDTVSITKRLVPPEVTYYHPGCYDPWADVTSENGTRVTEAIDRLEPDPVNAPAHYRWLPNGIEVIDITETLGFCLGNVVKYALRADHKGKPLEDLRKAEFYLRREIANRESGE